jgi:hypothetical protein
MRTPEGHKLQRSAKCAMAHEQADDKADVVLLDSRGEKNISHPYN